MGVPKFYRWLSERYPLINQAVNNALKPEIDNLYLDMNGIVHNCTHGGDGEEDKKLTEDQMMANIFKYLDKLFNIVRPQQLIFMAIDGVAPRAKMNQQRQRRFRAAKDAQEAREEAARRGDEVSENPFDSNCITPGTEFMERLSTNIKYFIRKKMKEDTAWQRVRVIFSGAEVPGEGEHKIMLFIRNMKMQPGYNPNLRHCLYGLDADLIMLSLVSHEPHFCLLREEVIFGSNRTSNLPRKMLQKLDEFQFLHISVLREYLDYEFSSLRASLPFPYDLERIIDDWVFLGFLVGNDFLPHLPTMDIGEGGLDTMYRIYREMLPTFDGYITHYGTMNRGRLEQIFKKLADLEESVFETRLIEEREFARRKRKHTKARVTEVAPEDDFDMLDDAKFEIQLAQLRGETKSPEIISAGEGELPPGMTFQAKYYHDKFPEFYKDQEHAPEYHIRQLCETYLEGLDWVLKYYYEGCRSWKWYFPYRYCPLASDMNRLDEMHIEHELGIPFRPLEQLLGVLPAASRKLLPPAYRDLMTSESSPIVDYYPEHFLIDMNGKKNPWEGIALIPFIDEKRLLSAVATIDASRLATSEKNRNRRDGSDWIIKYDPDNHDTHTCNLAGFPNITECQSSVTKWVLPDIPQSPTSKSRSLNEQHEQKAKQHADNKEDDEAEMGSMYRSISQGRFLPTKLPGVIQPQPGYPWLHSLPADSNLSEIGVNVFGRESQKETLVVKLKVGNDDVGVLSKKMIGQRTFADWPYLKECLVIAITDGRTTYTEQGAIPNTTSDYTTHVKDCAYYQHKFLTTKGVDIGNVQILVTVRMFERMKRMTDGSIRKVFSKQETSIPAQLILTTDLYNVTDPRFVEKQAPTVQQAFPLNSPVVYIGPSNYGSIGTISTHTGSTVTIRITPSLPEPTFGHKIAASSRMQYYPAYMIARSLGITGMTLSKVTSSVYVNPGNVDLGLKIKFSRQNLQVDGYARRVEAWHQQSRDAHEQGMINDNTGGQWEYSERAIAIIAAYKKRFPKFFEILDADPDAPKYDAELFANNPGKEGAVEMILLVSDWLKTTGIANLILVPCTSQMMDVRGVAVVQEEATRYINLIKSQPQPQSINIPNVPLYHLYAPTPIIPWSPSERDIPDLGDRVINIRSDEGVPFGIHGTVVAIHHYRYAEIVFDEEILTGNSLQGRCAPLRGKTLLLTSILNLSKPRILTPKTPGAPSSKPKQQHVHNQLPPSRDIHTPQPTTHHTKHHIHHSKSSQPLVSDAIVTPKILQKEKEQKQEQKQDIKQKQKTYKPKTSDTSSTATTSTTSSTSTSTVPSTTSTTGTPTPNEISDYWQQLQAQAQKNKQQASADQAANMLKNMLQIGGQQQQQQQQQQQRPAGPLLSHPAANVPTPGPLLTHPAANVAQPFPTVTSTAQPFPTTSTPSVTTTLSTTATSVSVTPATGAPDDLQRILDKKKKKQTAPVTATPTPYPAPYSAQPFPVQGAQPFPVQGYGMPMMQQYGYGYPPQGYYPPQPGFPMTPQQQQQQMAYQQQQAMLARQQQQQQNQPPPQG